MKTIKELSKESPNFNPMNYGYELALKDVLELIDEEIRTGGDLSDLKERITGWLN